MSIPAKSPPSNGLLKGYDPETFFDEMQTANGTVRPHYQRFRELFQSLMPDEFDHKRQSVDLAFLRQGVTFNVYGDSAGTEKIFPFDLLPRIIPAKEWELLERGLAQRINWIALRTYLKNPGFADAERDSARGMVEANRELQSL